MKKTIAVKAVVGVAILLILLYGGYYLYIYGTFAVPATCTIGDLKQIGGVVDSYIRHSGSRFPSSENELIQGGYIKKISRNGGYKYLYSAAALDPSWEKDHWIILPSFGRMQLKYGFDVRSVEEVDGKLYDIATGKQVLLIEGPYIEHEFAKNVYEAVSLHWYSLLQKPR